ncbi:PIN domain-containing protein [Dyadobacter sp. MSC1_007]|jgi:predicted nucleic acid-binding protein|uniref:PIN domain-containing protein n=1 Tax=Dyadobacter sp. MSC1_007 TaxID=2909264 RepID=UPI002547EE66|nr:PIN domain-containing protein [Dyadobacter sp. MSC1_007]
MNDFAVDTNILMYLYDSDNPNKRSTSESLLASTPSVSAQVVSEFLNVTKRLQKLHKRDILEKCTKALRYCKITPTDHNVLDRAMFLLNRYDFQMFDSIIVAAALESQCQILYSEDLQHRQVIDGKLTIINPFL